MSRQNNNINSNKHVAKINGNNKSLIKMNFESDPSYDHNFIDNINRN